MQYTTKDGVRLTYELHQNQKTVPVVFVHGFPFSKMMWRPQIEFLQNDFSILAFDIRGHGESEVGDGQYSLELLVDDFFGLLDHLDIRQCIAIGLSMGGYILLRAVQRNPERFGGLVLCDTKSEADTDEIKLRRAAQAKAVKSMDINQFAEAFVKNVFASEAFQRHPGAVRQIHETIAQTSPTSIAGTLLALAGRSDTTAVLPNISVPVLILVGQLDAVTPVSSSLSMKERIAGSEFHAIPHAGHLSNLENPEEFNRHLDSFLRRIVA